MLPYIFIIFFCIFSIARTTGQTLQLSDTASDSTILFSPVVNSIYQESSPSLSLDGRTLYFSRRGHPRNFGGNNADDIWISYLQKDNTWSRPVNLGAPVNTPGNDRLAGINAAGNRLYLYSDQPPPADSSLSSLKMVERQGRSWGIPQPVLIDSFYNFSSQSDYFIGADENAMILSVERRDGAGNRDLHISFRKPDGTWTVPESLGPAINTPGDERHAVLAADNRTLYFSSDGYPGSGGTDILMCRRLDDSWTLWTVPVNLGPRINTPSDDDHFTIAAAGDLLIHSRNAGPDGADLFSSLIPEALQPVSVVLIKGTLASKNPNADVHQLIFGASNNDLKKILVRKDQSFRFILPAHLQAVNLFATAGDSFGVSRTLTLAGPDPNPADWAPPEILEKISADEAYQEREAVIAVIAGQLMHLDKEYSTLEYQINAYREIAPPALGLHSTDYLNYPPVAGLKKKYRALEENITQRSSATGPGRPLQDYPGFCTAIWDQLAEELLAQVKNKIDRQVTLGLLEEQKRTKRTDEALIRFLEERLYEIPAVDSTLMFPITDTTASLSPQEALIEELQGIFRPMILNRLEIGLPPHATTALTDEIRYFRKTIQRENLREELRKKVARQVEFEQDIKAPAFPTPPAVEAAGDPHDPAFSEIQVVLELVPFEAGQLIPLNGIFFPANGAFLLPESDVALERLARRLRERPGLGIEIRTHTNGRLPHFQALALTNARAQALAARLEDLGTDPGRLHPVGYGKVFNPAGNSTPEERLVNQRTEILIFRQD